MTSILDIGEPVGDRGLCVVCAAQPRALPMLSRCWACIKAAVDQDRQHRSTAPASSDKEATAS